MDVSVSKGVTLFRDKLRRFNHIFLGVIFVIRRIRYIVFTRW